MSDWTERVIAKVDTLRAADPTWQYFGTFDHQYRFGRTLSEQEVIELEKRYGVELPGDYRQFLTTVGNGGCGPGYGLQRFGDERALAAIPQVVGTGVMRDVVSRPYCKISVEEMVDARGNNVDRFEVGFFDAIGLLCKDPGSLRRPFPLTTSIFKDYPYELSTEEEHLYSHSTDGTILMCHYGCGISALLVVTGEQPGTVWVDDPNIGSIGHFADYGLEATLHGGRCQKQGPQHFADWFEDWLDKSLVQMQRASELALEKPEEGGFFHYQHRVSN